MASSIDVDPERLFNEAWDSRPSATGPVADALRAFAARHLDRSPKVFFASLKRKILNLLIGFVFLKKKIGF
jgi:hypothetical protein